MRVSIVVPCYRSELTLPALVEQVTASMADLVARSVVDEWELILVVDGSPDSTAAVARGLAGADSPVTALEFRRNFGQHNALLAGIRAARFEVVVTIDDDLQHPPDQIGVLLDELDRTGCDVVYGVPHAEEHGVVRSAASRIVKTALAASGVSNARIVGAFRAFRTDLRDGFTQVNDPHPNIDVLLSWTTTAVRPAAVVMAKRTVGESGYSLPKLVRHAVGMITGYSLLPLRLATWFGFGFGALGIATLIWVLVAYWLGQTTVPGFTTTVGVVALFSGVQLVTIGIIGEYLGRQYFRSMNKPTYLVRSAPTRGSGA